MKKTRYWLQRKGKGTYEYFFLYREATLVERDVHGSLYLCFDFDLSFPHEGSNWIGSTIKPDDIAKLPEVWL